MWGYFGQAEKPEAFWGPRGLAVDKKGNVYVTDTGNKRVVVFTPDGEFVTQFGQAGIDPGQFDEPVGIAIDNEGLVYVADTWNARIQVFAPDATGVNFSMQRSWEVSAWYGQSLDNKPFMAIGPAGNLFVADPEGFRVLEFDPQGKFIMGWGDYSTNTDGFGLVSGVAVDAAGRVWVSDGANNRLLRFNLPSG
ncbi:MAG TPA: NHL repeat-containing protein [Leptolinea sp.]